MMDADPVQSASKPSCEIIQGGSATMNLSEKDGGQEIVPKSVKSSTPVTPIETLNSRTFDCAPKSSTPVLSNEPLIIKASDCELKSSTLVTTNETLSCKAADCRTLKKSKKKLMRHQIPSLHLRAILFWPSLGIQKKKKHKKVKHSIVDAKGFIREHLLNDSCLSLELVQPFPKGVTVVNGLTNSLKKGSNFFSKESNILTRDGVRVLVDTTDEEDKVKDCPNSPELANDKKLQKGLISTSETNQRDMKKLDRASPCKANGMQTGLMSRLTQGLAEITVAHWDGVELPPSPIEDVNGADLSIGYVPDDWDEEYDRSKRKKLRVSKRQFGGWNPFQEIASKKAKHERRAKRNRSSSRNPPFRM